MTRTIILEAVKHITDTYVVTGSDQVLIADGTFSITLFSVAARLGYTLTICNRGTGTITVLPAGTELIEGAASLTVAAGRTVVLKNAGTQWRSVLNTNVDSATTAGTANNATYAFGKSEADLNANSSLTANNADYLDSQHGSYYRNASNLNTGTVPSLRLNGTYANATANNATYAFGKAEGALNVNSAATANTAGTANNSTYAFGKTEGALNANSALTANNADYSTTAGTANNATYAFGKSEADLNANSSLTANNADYLDGEHANAFPLLSANNIFTGAVQTLPLVFSNGIQFPANQVASDNANRLDDYEEGTWVPVIGGLTSESGQSYDLTSGSYIKIGRLVIAQFDVRLTVKGTITGTYVCIKGLPFTVNATINGPGTIAYWSSLATAWMSIQPHAQLKTTHAVLYGVKNAATATTVGVAPDDIGNDSRLMGTIIYIAAT